MVEAFVLEEELWFWYVESRIQGSCLKRPWHARHVFLQEGMLRLEDEAGENMDVKVVIPVFGCGDHRRTEGRSRVEMKRRLTGTSAFRDAP